MKVVIKTKNLKLNKSLRDFIEEKINSLEKFSEILYSKKYFNHLPERSEGWRRANALRLLGKGKPSPPKFCEAKFGKARIEAWIEIGRITLHHKKGPVFWAECQMRFPGKSLRATFRAEDLKFAIGEVKDELQEELKKYKEKKISQRNRKTRVFKKELHLSPPCSFLARRKN